ncbi:MAG TPA: protein kinase [Gemmatimonadaceae bacterium]|nr:protein kinase [Gemmatimonadaceae bacterium]
MTEGQNPPPLSPDAMPGDPDTLLPQLQEATTGEYEIIGELGRGGMAAVYLARDISLNRKVAIKTMLPELTGKHDMVMRFKREAQMAAGLSHPHIVQIHSVKQTNRIVYFVMKFIEGRGLDSIISEHGALDVDMTRLVLQQAASALSFAHHRGVIHRDVKPANIMIDENGWAVMTDFGIAKIDDGNNLTATGQAVGTPHYMAPEQFHNKPLTASADQYSLGVVVYEMLTGRKPFDGSTLAEIITQHLFNPAPDIRKDRPDLPATVSDAVARMLAKEPLGRFPDLDAAIAVLGAPDPNTVEATRGRLMSLARINPNRKVGLSVPMSPVPATRPSARTAVVPGASAPVSEERAPRVSQPPVASAVAPARKGSRKLIWISAVVVLLAVGAFIGARSETAADWTADRNPAMRRGVRLWQEGKPELAAAEFNAATRQLPRRAMPHVYLSRIARERGDLSAAFREAARAAQLEPNNALALREVGSVFLARNDYDAARRFFVRALRVNPSDKVAMGWLACSFHRMGDPDQSSRWAARAGEGPWSACLR